MHNINIDPTPLYRLNNLSEYLGIDLWVKRDDLISLYLGGNKVRKNLYILNKSIDKPDVLITNGGAESNHARVVALMGTQMNMQVELVLHGEEPKRLTYAGNSYLMSSSNANRHYVASSDISHKISELKDFYEKQSKQVLVIPGGAHSPTGAEAYADAVKELSFEPDKIVLASGTGGTQAGLISGVQDNKLNTEVIGISIARNKDRGIPEILELLPDHIDPKCVNFDDNYTFGGYEKYTKELLDLLKIVVQIEGLPLDPTYTGKAMFALFQMVKNNQIKPQEKVIFWHTGGLLNLQSFKE